jgi:2-iminobutanoate/2-iminopropanoate deaminase
MKTLRAINPPGSGIPGISQGMIVENGSLMFLSGHVPIADDGSVAGPALEDQLVQTFANLKKTLNAAGVGFEDVVRLTIYVRDYRPEQLPVIREARDRFVDAARPPASALIGVAALFHPDVFVEVDAIAAIPERP